ncbi:hypothetical protein PHYBLDRAFT_174145 [Phycomyces blakesleeanus NRRL 1555(-)]|uniref:Mitochondrial adapter protein MCP1 transmembrane domain-containing protein n=2 Tax=Phycomyces blakesleeanus TaxID=4837 RepID=A0A162ZKN0_PHYB8|nr:hypothetical protein PHYBLDRAFT_174145 [Phycomyces blakesleeanus NRRL 1555(-)]OAD67451.1 hypothetical protein PHYBLDRAFT_174145 [Phycomyces blakesleeanus NRRL 1555(-)]|eukprot:XP_018285491.1 hypothetical protein PHYBLDRAFT_174145 [Phycomyces blakesleeanus NRRL 1555(-)]
MSVDEPTPLPLPLSLRRPKIYSFLTFVQSASALSFSTFAVIHGVQIVIAAINGVDSANQSLLLARPLYQDQNLEAVLVTGAATIHVLAGLVKSTVVIRRPWKTLVALSSQAPHPQSNLESQTQTQLFRFHSLSGLVLIPLVGFHHHLVRRLPARYFGDSAFVDFGLISWGLQNRAYFTWGLHTLLIGAAVYHGVSGAALTWRRVFGTKAKAKTKIKTKSYCSSGLTKKIVGAGIGCALIAGLVAIGRTKKIPLRREYKAIYDMISL